MKRIKHNTYLICAFVVLALVGTMSACVEYQGPNSGYGANGKLSVKGTVSEATVVTRAESDEDLMEKQLNTLDVFVEHVGGQDQGTFMKQYHLVTTEDQPIEEAVNNLLAEHWVAEGLVIGEYYNIYVAANNTQTKDLKDLTAFNVAALKALVADEITDGIAILDDDGNIARDRRGGVDTTTGNIYKLYDADANPSTSRALTKYKEFMMDGVIKNWTPNTTSLEQVFGADDKKLILKRAAAKFVLKVNFDADFLKSLTHDKKIVDGDETWVEKPAAQQVTITGTPAWKFYNFAFEAPVFTPETQGNGVEVHNSGFNIVHNKAYAGDDKNFTITTYSYPNKWLEADYSTKAPSLVISVGFTENGVTNYHYYRIPLVKSTVTSIERNHIYMVNATIATRGSAAQEDVTVTENIQYAVLPWNDENNSAAIHSDVQSVQHYYFNANPKVYTLRGDGDQSVTINYSKASGTKVNWKLFTYDANGNQTGVVAKDATGATRAWFYDADGKFTTSYGDSNTNPWTNMGVTITQSNEGTSGSSGKVTVTSTALTNKAIKYIRLRVYLDETVIDEETGDEHSLEETYHEDIIIRHFPTDNIQSIEGKWSSYHDPTEASSTTIYKTRNLEEAQSLAQQYNVLFTSEEIETTELINYATWFANRNVAGFNRETPVTRTRTQFSQAVTSNENRRAANGEANGVLSDGYYYWGENPSTVNNQADYYIRNYGYYTYYAYQNRYRTRYTHTYTYTEYTLELPIPSTGEWVNWEDRESHNSQRTYSYSYLGNSNYNLFYAKVFVDGMIRYMFEQGSGRWEDESPYTTIAYDYNTGLTNNHMYVIQISSSSNKYVLGRPYVNTSTHQSQDDVVSPAFMIASQLGAVSPFSGRYSDADNAADASTHCSRYMEVTEDGIYYTGWRLPTAAEIKVITEYQYGNIGGVTVPSNYRVLTPVLTGYYYWDLAGGAQRAWQASPEEPTYTASQDKAYLRCVRDLSAEEVERLNGFDKIQEKYR